MAFTATAYDNFVNNVQFTVLDAVKEMQPDIVRSLYMQVPWTPGSGNEVEFTSLTLPSYGQRVAENETYPEQNPTEGDTLSKRQIQYGDKMNISRQMAHFNKYPQAIAMAKNLVLDLKNILDLEMTIQIFNESDQTTFTPRNQSAPVNIATADTLALESGSHTVNGAPASTFDNQATAGALNLDNLTTAQQLGQANTVNDFGTAISPNFDTLVIANDSFMIKKARELLGSSLTPETSNNAVNVYDGAMKLVVLKHGVKDTLGAYSTANRYAWAIFDSNMVKGSFQYQVSMEPQVEPRFVSSDNLVASFLVTQMAAFAAVRWQGTVYNRSTTQP